MLICHALSASAEQVILHKSDENIRAGDAYPLELLRAALSRTEASHGAFTLQRSSQGISRLRAIREMASGENINVLVSPPARAWDNKMIRVQFPIARGFLSYRLFLIKQKHLPLLHSVSSLAELKSISTGSGTHWSLTDVYQHNQVNVVLGVGENSLIDMFKNDRFITFSRGLNEVFAEHDTLKHQIPDLVVDEKLLLYVHMPTYFYVSPVRPQLAERLKQGLISLHSSGELDMLFAVYHGAALERARLSSRKVFRLPNPNTSEQDYQDDRPYLLELDMGQ